MTEMSPLKILVTSLHLDATYKYLDLNYLIVIFGISDLTGSFHLGVFVVIFDETAKTYEWILQTLKDMIDGRNIINNLSNIIADNSLAILAEL